MIIDLPKKKFVYKNKNGGIEAYIDKDRVLKMKNDVSFKKLMKDIAYAINDKKICYYCGRKLKENEATPDHKIPQDIGGPTIPNNLCTACSKCNSEKSNLLLNQYLVYKLIKDEKEKKSYRDICLKRNEYFKRLEHELLLPGMITYMKSEDIKLSKIQSESNEYHFKKFREIDRFYKKYSRLKKAIIVDKNLRLLGGFITLMYCKENGIEIVPVIILENVEIID